MIFEIKKAEMYFIYSFMCDKAVNIEDKNKEYCEEFRDEYGVYDREEGYRFAYKKRISRQLILNMPYKHIEDKIDDLPINLECEKTNNIRSFLNLNECKYITELLFTNCILKIYEDGKSILRFNAHLKTKPFVKLEIPDDVWKKIRPLNDKIDYDAGRKVLFLKAKITEDEKKELLKAFQVLLEETCKCPLPDREKYEKIYINAINAVEELYKNSSSPFLSEKDLSSLVSIQDIVRFMDVSSLPEVWNWVKDRIKERGLKGIEEVEEDVKTSNIVPKEDGFIWQTPQILLHLKLDNYEEFVNANCDDRLKWIHYILNKSRGSLNRTDISFASYHTSVLTSPEKFDALNICYDNALYYTLSPDVCLFVTASKSPPEFEPGHYNSSIEWVKIRVLEVYEYLRLRWYSLTVADELLDKAIQDLEAVGKKLDIDNDSGNFNTLIAEVKKFLSNWIKKKCIILRTFEDPSTQRCAGLSFNLLYKKGEECFLINELEDMVKFKLEHIDKVYTDIMDLARIKMLEDKSKKES